MTVNHNVSKEPLIEEHGVIGNLVTAALVCLDGSIDFMCYPRFNSSTIFAQLLDKEKGGSFSLRPEKGVSNSKQMYYPNTNILMTRFMEEGIIEITDFMPIKDGKPLKALVRKVKGLKGSNNVSYHIEPRYDYASQRAEVVKSEKSIYFKLKNTEDESAQKGLKLFTNIDANVEESKVSGTFELREGEDIYFALVDPDGDLDDLTDISEVDQLFDQTRTFWNQWVSQCTYKGKWSQAIIRSALTLKMLLPFEQGNLMASPTFGLPEAIGGERNWDYRYTWIRDTTFTFYALSTLGFNEEAKEYMNWITKSCKAFESDKNPDNGPLEVLYDMDGRSKTLEERELNYLQGYKNSRPVRIGNDAFKQKQIDIYGEFMDMLSLVDKKVSPVSHEMWKNAQAILGWLEDHWQDPDKSIWELRSKPRQHCFSVLMCWVAFDRGIKMAIRRSLPGKLSKWRAIRDEIFHYINDVFYNEKIGAFTQYKDSEVVDASLLRMTLLGFISFTDPKWLSTLKRIEADLIKDSLVKRYDLNKEDMEDGLGQEEGYLVVCCFWYIENLARSGDTEKAWLMFERILSYSNHLGLFSEELSDKGELLGNFPQALSHLGLINTVINLERAVKENRKTKTPGSGFTA